MKNIFLLSVFSLVALLGCEDKSDTSGGAAAGSSYTQIERLARPAINEGLVFTQAYNKAFNSIAPSSDLTPAASAVVSEAAVVLGLVKALGTAAGVTPTSNVLQIAGGFLPDVMRVNTANNFTIDQQAYAGDFTVISASDGFPDAPMLTGGRKLTDDVMDNTLSYLLDDTDGLLAGTLGDGVTYNGATSIAADPTDCTDTIYKDAAVMANSNQPGHGCLVGQTVRNNIADVANNVSFPFIPAPWSEQ